MPSKKDEAAARLAATGNLVSQEQARECMKTVANAEAQGKKATVIDVMVQQKMITPDQGKELQKKVESKVRTKLGDYEILSKLGEGGMGAVYRARHVPMDRIVALKVLSKELSKDEQFVQRFYREARASAKLEHPNVVLGYDVGQAGGLHYFAMEFIDGQSVQDLLDNEGPMDVAEAVRIVRDVASALAHAQTIKMVHRDVKPGNIMLTKQGVVKLADLGLAKQIDQDSGLTQTGAGFGTPYYMAPEQAKNAKYVDGRSDIYALGATLYHMVTGIVPYDGETAMEVLLKKERGKYVSARRHNVSVSERLDLIVEKMMSPEPKHRHQACDEVIQDLESTGLLAGVPRGGTPTVPPAPRGAHAGGQATAPAPARTRPAGPGTRTPKPGAAGAPQTGRPAPKTQEGRWYVRFRDKSGKQQRVLGDTAAIRKMIQRGVIGTHAKASNSPDTGYRPITAVAEFQDLMAARVMQEKTERRTGASMAETYAAMEKDYARKKLIRKLKLWLKRVVILAAIGIGGYLLYTHWLEGLLDQYLQ